MKTVKFAVPIIAAGALVVMLWILWTYEEPPVPERSRIVAKTNLKSLTLVNDKNLQPRSDGKTTPDIKGLTNRYLLVGVDEDKEVTDQMLAPEAATALLSDAVAVSVPAGATTIVGNQLRTGDLVDVIAAAQVPKEGTTVKKFENLMILLPATKDSNTIVLAVPSTQRDDFASALVGTQLLISRKIAAIKP